MKTQLVAVTPSMARDILARDHELRQAGNAKTRQRALTSIKVTQYREDMKKGSWRLNHQGVLIAESGEILDGQHRLHSISGMPDSSKIQMLVNHVPAAEVDGIILTIDAGKPRDVATQLYLEYGLDNAYEVVAAVRAQASLVAGAGSRFSGLSSKQIVDLVDKQQRGLEAVVGILGGNISHTARYRGGQGSRVLSGVAGPIGLYSTINRGAALDFADSLKRMVNLDPDSPVLWLHHGIEKMQGKLHKVYPTSVMVANALLGFERGTKFDSPPSTRVEAGRKWLIEKSPVAKDFMKAYEQVEKDRSAMKRLRDADRKEEEALRKAERTRGLP